MSRLFHNKGYTVCNLLLYFPSLGLRATCWIYSPSLGLYATCCIYSPPLACVQYPVFIPHPLLECNMLCFSPSLGLSVTCCVYSPSIGLSVHAVFFPIPCFECNMLCVPPCFSGELSNLQHGDCEEAKKASPTLFWKLEVGSDDWSTFKGNDILYLPLNKDMFKCEVGKITLHFFPH